MGSPPLGLPARVARRRKNQVTGVSARTDRRSLETMDLNAPGSRQTHRGHVAGSLRVDLKMMVRVASALRGAHMHCHTCSPEHENVYAGYIVIDILSIKKESEGRGLDHGVGHPRLPLDYAPALQHRRPGTGEDADMMLTGHPWPRRYARPMRASLSSHRRYALQWYMLQASSASACALIWYGRIRPISGELPKGTSKFIDARPWSTPQWPTR